MTNPMRAMPVSPVITFFPIDDQAAEPIELMNSHSWIRVRRSLG